MSEKTDLLIAKVHNSLAHALGIIIMILLAWCSWSSILVPVICGIVALVLAIRWSVTNSKLTNRYMELFEEKKEE